MVYWYMDTILSEYQKKERKEWLMKRIESAKVDLIYYETELKKIGE